MKLFKIKVLLSGNSEPSEQKVADVSAQEQAMLTIIETNPNALSDPEIKAWYEQYQSLSGEGGDAGEGNEGGEGDEGNEGGEGNEGNEGGDAGEGGEGEEGNEGGEGDEGEEGKPKPNNKKSKNPFFKAKSDDTEIKGVTEKNLKDVVSKKFGIDTSKANWLETFLNSALKQRAQASQASNVSKEVDATRKFLAQLPAELKVAIEAYAAKEDWKTAMSSFDKTDYSKTFDKLTPEEKTSFIKSVLKKEVDLTKEDESTKSILELAEQAYDLRKEKATLAQNKLRDKIKSEEQKKKETISLSLKSFKQQFPDFDEDSESQILSVINEKGIASLFLDDEGSYRPDIIKRIAFVLYGDTLLEELTSSAEARGANSVREEVIEKSISRKGSGKGKGVKTFTQQEEKFLTSAKGILDSYKDPYA